VGSGERGGGDAKKVKSLVRLNFRHTGGSVLGRGRGRGRVERKIQLELGCNGRANTYKKKNKADRKKKEIDGGLFTKGAVQGRIKTLSELKGGD